MPGVKARAAAVLVTWFAGLFYLPRLFVYHASTSDGPGVERFRGMERPLFAIMTLGALLTAGFGIWLLVINPGLLKTGRMQAKIALLALLVAYHVWCWRLVRDFAAGRNVHLHLWYRWVNEVHTLLLIRIVRLGGATPF